MEGRLTPEDPRSAGAVQPPVGHALQDSIGTASSRIQVVIEAAEKAAAGIIDDAEAQARTYLEESRRRAELITDQRAKEVASMTDALIECAEAAKHQSDELLAVLDQAKIKVDEALQVHMPEKPSPPAGGVDAAAFALAEAEYEVPQPPPALEQPDAPAPPPPPPRKPRPRRPRLRWSPRLCRLSRSPRPEFLCPVGSSRQLAPSGGLSVTNRGQALNLSSVLNPKEFPSAAPRPLAVTTAERIGLIIEAAEQAAAGVIDDAAQQARRHVEEAQAQANRLAAERLRTLADELDPPSSAAPTPPERSERRLQPVEEIRPEAAPPRRSGSAGARLLATQMAVSGSSRAEIEARLRSGFEIEDTGEILDAILGPKE